MDEDAKQRNLQLLGHSAAGASRYTAGRPPPIRAPAPLTGPGLPAAATAGAGAAHTAGLSDIQSHVEEFISNVMSETGWSMDQTLEFISKTLRTGAFAGRRVAVLGGPVVHHTITHRGCFYVLKAEGCGPGSLLHGALRGSC